MKKILALVLAFAMVFSSIPVVFADSVSEEAKALAMIGALKGDNGGVTAEYLAKPPTRLQAAIMLLRLKGLEAEAMAYVSEDNFEDVKDYPWVEGRNIMAYLKANPAVGFRGTDKGFEPNREITALEFYKVLLVSLGYVETTADVVGDFTWDTLKDKLAEVGLGALLEVTSFTNDHMAKATVEALGLKVKDSDVTLLGKLIEAGVVKEEDAVAAGLLEEAPVLEAAVKSAKALGNTVVEVTFDGEINEAAADASLYDIEGLEVEDAVVAGKDVVRLTTSAMTTGKVYTLTVGEEKVKFTGVAKVTGAPKLEKAEGTDEQRVKLTFDKNLDYASASDVANYAIAGATVIKAAVDGKTVTLTTEGMVANKNYTVKVTNIASVDGGVLKSASKVFLAKTDKTAPKLDRVEAKTNTRVVAIFNEDVTEESATDIANYTIKAGDEELEIVAIEMVKDSKNSVEITTAPQKSGKKYELTVNNIVDRKVLANTMTKEGKKTFYGKAEDKAAPVLSGFNFLSKTLVEVTFNDASRLDPATTLDANNYTFNNDIDVESVEFEDPDDKDCKTVLLTVSELTLNKLYKLSVAGVADEYGNAMEEGKVANSKSKTFTAADLEAAKVKSVKASGKEIVVEFTNKKLNTKSAESVANYSVNNDVLVPVSAEYNSTKNTVTLTTGVELTAGKTYKLTIDGLLDLAGNTLKSTNSFIASATSIDTDAPSVEYVEALNANVIAVTFDEPMKKAGTLKVDLNNDSDFDGANETLPCVDKSDDGTVLYFSAGTALWTNESDHGVAFDITYDSIVDAAGNALVLADLSDDVKVVYGNIDEIDDIVLEGVEQSAVNEFTLYFSGKLDKTSVETPNNLKVVAGPNSSYATLTGGVTAELDSDDASIVYVKGSYKLDKIYKLQITGNVKGIFGETVLGEYEEGTSTKNQYVDLYAALEDEDAPVIEKVEAKYNDTIVITYNEDLRDGSYRYEVRDADGKVLTTSPGVVKDNEVTITITGTKKLVAGELYTLVAKSVVYDLAGNKTTVDANDEYYFEGTNLVAVDTFVTVNVINRGTIQIVTNKGNFDGVTVSVYRGTDLVDVAPQLSGTSASQTIEFSKVFVDGVEYTLKFSDGKPDTKFTGLAEVFITGTATAGTKVTLYNTKEDGSRNEVVDSIIVGDDGTYKFSVTNGKYRIQLNDADELSDTEVTVADDDVSL